VVDAATAVRLANRSFYDAFEARDFDAMSDVWERSDRALCTHPGWATLKGWAAVAGSFFALFQSSQSLQFILTEERVFVQDGVAWVAVDENLLGDQGGSTVAAVNVFVREPVSGRWRTVSDEAEEPE
jgi:ketosteroid isomerase-like protein